VDDTAVATHRETSHYKDYLSRIPDLADRMAVVLRPILVEEPQS